MYLSNDKLGIVFEESQKSVVYDIASLLQAQIELIPFRNPLELPKFIAHPIFFCCDSLSSFKNFIFNRPVKVFTNNFSFEDIVEFSQKNRLTGIFKFPSLTEILAEELNEANHRFVMSDYDNLHALTKFTQKVARIESLSELMNELEQEFKKLKKVNSPILAISNGDASLDLYFMQGKVRKVTFNENLPLTLRMRRNSIADRNLLATAMGRPVIKTLAVPISESIKPITVFLEHDLSDVELDTKILVQNHQ